MRRAALVLLLAACGPATGSIEGDVYLVGSDGEAKRAAGTTVHLVPVAGMARFDSIAGPLCRGPVAERDALEDSADDARWRFLHLGRMGKYRESLAAFDALRKWGDSSSKYYWAADSAARLAATVAARVVTADVNGHFRVDSVPPGEGFLWVVASRGDTAHYLSRSLNLRAGEVAKLDLHDPHRTYADNGCEIMGIYPEIPKK